MKVTESRNIRETKFHTRRQGQYFRTSADIGPNSIDWTHNRTTRKRLHMAYKNVITHARDDSMYLHKYGKLNGVTLHACMCGQDHHNN